MRLHITRGQQQNAVSVDHAALRVGEHGAVSIAIESDSDVVLAVRRRYRLRNVLGVQRAASGVDIASGRVDVQKVGCDSHVFE